MAEKFRREGVHVNFGRLKTDENLNITENRKWKKESGIPYFAIIKDGKHIDYVLGARDFKNRLNRKLKPLLGSKA
jgi:hypothetical protein